MSDDTHKDAQERAERVLGKVYMAEKEREEKEELDRVTSLRNFQRTTKRNRNFRKEDFSNMGGDTSHHNHESYDSEDDNNDYRGGEEEEEEDDAISITSQVSCLTMPQLQDKLRSSQITLMKLKENSTLKYLRLQQEHNRLKDSLPTLECKVSDAKEYTKQILKERDDAKQKSLTKQSQQQKQDRILKRIADENESLRIKLQQLKQTSAQFLKERDQYGHMVESCTCRGTELKDVTEDDDDNNLHKKNKNRRDILQRRQSTRTKQGYGPPSYTRRNSSSYYSTSGRTHNSIHTSVSSDMTRKGSDKNIDWDKDGYLY